MMSLSTNPHDQSVQYIFSILHYDAKPTDICSLPGMSLVHEYEYTDDFQSFVRPFLVIKSPEDYLAQDARDLLIAFLDHDPYNTTWKLTQVTLERAAIIFYFHDNSDRQIILQGDSFHFPQNLTFSLSTANDERLDFNISPKCVQLFYLNNRVKDHCVLHAISQDGPRAFESKWYIHCRKYEVDYSHQDKPHRANNQGVRNTTNQNEPRIFLLEKLLRHYRREW